MDLGALIHLIVVGDQARILVALVLANLVLGVVAAVKDGTFDLTRLSDFARTRLIPVIVVYAVGVLVSWASPDDPILGKVRDVVFSTESAVLIALLLANLESFGITLPPLLTGKGGPAPINAAVGAASVSTDVATK